MKWNGAAAICIRDDCLLMVRQGKKHEPTLWTVPSGEQEQGETFESCCIRELMEETGYIGEIIKPLHIKTGNTFGYDVTVHYFLVRIIGGKPSIQDPDELIHEIRWVKRDEIHTLDLSFPEDVPYLLDLMGKCDKT